jgi:hypothetical protein
MLNDLRSAPLRRMKVRAILVSSVVLVFSVLAAPAEVSKEEAKSIREEYMGGQLTASTFVYGLSLMSAFQLEGGAALVVPAFAVTGSLIAHSVYVRNAPLTEGQVLGMNYAAATSIFSSYAIPYIAMGSDANAFRIGSALALVAYPVSLMPGNAYGRRYNQHPWDLNKKMMFAGAFATAGAVLPWVYLKDPDPDVYMRLAPLQFLAFGAAGHFAADLYRPGERLTDGVTTGIFTHTALGTLAGFTLVPVLEPESPQAAVGMVLASAVGGFAEGLWFFNDRYDDAERANFASLGLAAGLLLPGSIAFASEASAAKTMVAMTIGGTLGYAVVYNILTGGNERPVEQSGRQDGGNTGRTGFLKSTSLSLVPVPEITRRAPEEVADARSVNRSATGYDTRYRVPGLIVRF